VTHQIGLLITGAIAGAMAFFTIVVAPTAFRVLSAEAAGTLVRHLFPVYYLVLAVAAAAAAMLTGFASPATGRILAVIAALFMAERVLLLPRMEQLRPARERGDEVAVRRFRRLHGLSMVLNLIAFAAVVVAFVLAS
jgi:hypothetical protein